MTRKALLGLLGGLLLTGCGYRAPLFRSYIPEVADTTEYEGVRAAYQQLAALMEKDTGLPPTEGNTVTLFPDAQKKREMLQEDLEYAQEAVYVETGSVAADLLREKAREGADVRLILDRGAQKKAQPDQLATLRADGVKLSVFHQPAMLIDWVWPARGTHRDHRKIVLLDGQLGYIGGPNTELRISGPAVADLSAVYMENQRRAAPHLPGVYVAKELEEAARMDNIPELPQFTDVTVQIVPDAPTDQRLPLRNGVEWAIGHAQKYFWFYNPCSPPPVTTLQALKDAAARGVDVRWTAPAQNEESIQKWMGESLYRELLEAGVRIYEWQGPALPATQLVTDDYLLAVGSASLDNLSFFLNYEAEALVYDEETARYAASVYLSDLESHCREITLEQVNAWSPFRKLRNWLTRHIGGAWG